ncbi:MAG: FxsA family protein [Thermoguttaceae bacterium]
MLGRLLLLFIVFPMVELALLVTLAQHTSLLFTIGMIIVTGMAGAWLARTQGLQCFRRIQAELSRGQMPADALVDGLMILVAGALLIAPGILTDLIGISMLLPPVRAVLKRWLIARFKHRILVSGFSSPRGSRAQPDDVIDVEHRSPDRPSRP